MKPRDLRAGDLFTVRGRRLVGIVASTSAVVGPTHGCIVAYVYADARLSRDALLLPPLLTTAAPWTHALFEPLRHEPLLPGRAHERHAFRDARGALFDELGRPLASHDAHDGPIGEYRLQGVDAIDAALATTTAAYDPPAPAAPDPGDVGVAVRDIMGRWTATFGRRPTRDEWLALYDAAADHDDEPPKAS